MDFLSEQFVNDFCVASWIWMTQWTVHIINPHTTILFVTIPQGYIPWQAEIWCYALWTTTLGGHMTSLIYWSISQTGPSTTFMHSSSQRRDTFLPSLSYQATPCLKSKNLPTTKGPTIFDHGQKVEKSTLVHTDWLNVTVRYCLMLRQNLNCKVRWQNNMKPLLFSFGKNNIWVANKYTNLILLPKEPQILFHVHH